MAARAPARLLNPLSVACYNEMTRLIWDTIQRILVLDATINLENDRKGTTLGMGGAPGIPTRCHISELVIASKSWARPPANFYQRSVSSQTQERCPSEGDSLSV